MKQETLFRNLGSWSVEGKTPVEKNLLSVIILLAGLFAGSLFVDVAQLAVGTGFSGHALRDHTIVESKGKTWVAYTEPKVSLKVLSENNCVACDPSEALVWLRRIVPTVEVEKVETTTSEGKRLIALYDVKTLPSFVFDKEVSATDFYKEAEPLFSEKNGAFVFDMTKIGLTVGKYLQAPPVTDEDIRVGQKDAPIQFMVFSDFACEYCRAYHTVVQHVLKNYGDKISFVFKQLPLPSHPQAQNAALAAACAAEQEKFMPYADLLFASQADWDLGQGTARLKSLSFRVPGLNYAQFSNCLDTAKFKKNIEADLKQAEDWNVSAAPATFVNSEFISGAAPYPDVKSVIDSLLAK